MGWFFDFTCSLLYGRIERLRNQLYQVLVSYLLLGHFLGSFLQHRFASHQFFEHDTRAFLLAAGILP